MKKKSSEVLSENKLDSEQEDDCDDLEDEEMSDGSAKAVDGIKKFDEHEHEDDHSIAFIGWKRNSCFTHPFTIGGQSIWKGTMLQSNTGEGIKNSTVHV